MKLTERQIQPAVAERPVLRLLERLPRQTLRRPPPPATVWSRLERWAGAILR
jgi:hypothetical protein